MGTLLLIVASIMQWILAPFLWSVSSIWALCKGEFQVYDLQLAIAKDAYGNVLGQYVMNSLLITPTGYRFGNRKETISSVFGKNERTNTLTWLGQFIAWVLNTIQEDHCKLAIDDNIN